MFEVDSSKCDGCGNCVDVCPRQAIAVHDGLAVISQGLCILCGACSRMCPSSAIKEIVPAYTLSWKGGDTMVYGGYGRGMGRGFGRRGGAGFGFRGYSPPWPYVGRGRGGLPRCWSPDVSMTSSYSPAPYFYGSEVNRGAEAEVDWLKSQTEAIKAELERVEARMRDLEAGE